MKRNPWHRVATKFVAPVLLAVGFTACGGGGGSGYGGPFSMGTDLVVTDIDGDGRADVITLTNLYGGQQVGSRIDVYRQTAAGVFAAPDTYSFGCSPWSLTATDIDGDGLPDLVVTDPGRTAGCPDPNWPGRAVYLLLQDRTQPGHFLAPRKLVGDIYTSVNHLAVGDFNADGVPDIALGEPLNSSRRVLLLLQDPLHRGTFLAPTEIAMPGAVGEIVAGDINGDGRSDLFFHMYYASGSTLAIMLQRPTGGFDSPVALAPQVGLNVQRLAILDVNGDGRPDLLAHFTPQSTDYRSKLTVLMQGSSGSTWLAPLDSSLQGIDGANGTAFGDLNSDGLPDVALAGSFPAGSAPLSPPNITSQVNLVMLSGLASYRLAATIGLPIQPDCVAIRDIDGDGRNDIILFDGASRVMVMLQSRTVPGSFGAPQPLR